MTTRSTLSGTICCIALLAVGCGSPSSSTDKPVTAPSSPAAEPEQTTQTVAQAAESLVAEAPVAADAPMETPVAEAVTASPTPPPAAAPTAMIPKAPPAVAPAAVPATPPASTIAAAAPTPAPTVAAPAAVAATPKPPAAPATTTAIADPGGAIAVTATKPGLERVGAEACGDCHDVQFDSWAGGAHAKRTPPLDCEDCHGPGSEYQSKSIMKDPAKAKAAGLVMPDKAFCAKCHKTGVDDAFMGKAHAHEE